MKAQLALIAAGTMSHNGSISTANATAANTGISSAVVAVLEVASVRKVTTNAKSSIIKKTGNAATKVNASPTCALSPDATKPRAKQIPPANNSNTPQGIWFACCQSISGAPLLSRTTNSAITANSATEASLVKGRPSHACQPPKGSARVIQASAVSAKMVITRRSALRQGPTGGNVIPNSVGKFRVTHHQAAGNSTAMTGIPHDIHWPKLIA